MTAIEFSRTIDKSVVHRVAVAEVFPTSAVRASDDTYLIGVQVPRQHGYFGDMLAATGYDPMFFLEAARQSFYVIAHGFLDVPRDRGFIMRGATLAVRDQRLLRPGTTPIDTVLRADVLERHVARDGTPAGFRMLCKAEIDGRTAVECGIDASWLTQDRMSALRQRGRSALGLDRAPVACAQPPRIRARLVNRRVPLNVVISAPEPGPDGQAATVVADLRHPTMFDHPLDHLPGMLEIEACRQLALASAGADRWQLVGIDAKFHAFAELDLPVRCHSGEQRRTGAALRASMRLTQADRLLAEADVELTPAVPQAGTWVPARAA